MRLIKFSKKDVELMIRELNPQRQEWALFCLYFFAKFMHDT